MSNLIQPDIPETLPLEDDMGKPYALHLHDDDKSWTLKVFDRRVLVAQVNCLVQGDALLLADIHVFDEARLPEGMFVSWLRSALGLKPRTANYQRRGMGTRLLQIVIERARRRNLSRIAGNLFPRDLSARPDLPTWYRNHGFEVDLATDGASGKISLDLR
ncbi:MAG: GNAT family N-acetyltransferase [Candidatus Solibacter sp.]|jgi:GNAT superfamily N-acetyltransferase